MATTEQIRPGDYADVMPDMDDEEFAALKRSIKENGFDETAPIVVTEDGEIVDGHHRFRACRELGIEPETITVDDPDAEQAYRVNLARRNLNDGTKRKVVANYLVDHWEGDRSLEDVADSLGVSTSTVSRAKERAEEMANPSERKWFSTEEKRQQVSDYLDRNPSASTREVADAVEADVSHATVGNWRGEWERPDNDEDAADGDDNPDENPTDTGGSGDVVEEYSGPNSDGDSETGDSSPPSDGPEPDPTPDDPSAGGEEESVSGDPADAEQPHPSDEADTPLQQALVKVDQLKAEKEELEGKLLEVAEIRTNASKAKSAVDAARRHLDGKDPSIESAAGELEHAQSVLEGIADE